MGEGNRGVVLRIPLRNLHNRRVSVASRGDSVTLYIDSTGSLMGPWGMMVGEKFKSKDRESTI